MYYSIQRTIYFSDGLTRTIKSHKYSIAYYVENMSQIIINKKKIFKFVRVIKFIIIETTSIQKFSIHVDNFVRTSRIMMHLKNLSSVKFIQLFDDKVEIV